MAGPDPAGLKRGSFNPVRAGTDSIDGSLKSSKISSPEELETARQTIEAIRNWRHSWFICGNS